MSLLFITKAKKVAQEPAAPFYSNLVKVLQAKMPNEAHPDMVRGLMRSHGIAEEEQEHSGIHAYLDDFHQNGGNKVKRDHLIERTQQRLPQIEVTHPSPSSPMYERPEDLRTYQEYSTPGGRNYKVHLLALPERKVPQADKLPDHIQVQPRGEPQYGSQHFTMTDTQTGEQLEYPFNSQEDAENYWLRQYQGSPAHWNFKGAHWHTPNVVAHARTKEFKDKDGNKVLHIDEIQSDWHQQGRKFGYRPDGYRANRAKTLANEYNQHLDAGTQMPRDRALLYLATLHNTNAAQLPITGPFKKNWHSLTLKHLLRHAAEKGMNKLTWTTGQHQVDRYGGANDMINSFEYLPIGKEDPVTGLHQQYQVALNGGRHGRTLFPYQLHDWIGEKMAERIFNKDGEDVPLSDGDTRGWRQIKDVDISPRLHGMNSFYGSIDPKTGDQSHGMIGKYMNDYAAKLHGDKASAPKVGTSHLTVQNPAKYQWARSMTDRETLFDMAHKLRNKGHDLRNTWGMPSERNQRLKEANRLELTAHRVSDFAARYHIHNESVHDAVTHSELHNHPDILGQLHIEKMAPDPHLVHVHSIDITPEMRHKLLYEGQPLWGDTDATLRKSVVVIYDLQKAVGADKARKIGDQLGVDWEEVDLSQFRRGLEVELEHEDVTGGDLTKTAQIALAHLKEKADYYTRLDKMEKARKVDGEHGWITNAKKHFGITNQPTTAGYILPDGDMLDFSAGAGGGVRGSDHREISGITHGFRGDDESGSGLPAMRAFIANTGAARVHFGRHDGHTMLDFSNPLTKEQKITLLRHHQPGSSFAIDAYHPQTKERVHNDYIESARHGHIERAIAQAEAKLPKKRVPKPKAEPVEKQPPGPKLSWEERNGLRDRLKSVNERSNKIGEQIADLIDAHPEVLEDDTHPAWEQIRALDSEGKQLKFEQAGLHNRLALDEYGNPIYKSRALVLVKKAVAAPERPTVAPGNPPEPPKYTRTPEFKGWFGDWEKEPIFASKVTHPETGHPLVVYHGTSRADRVGDRFQKKRATSGPMQYFTDDPEIASNYANSKPDNSLDEDNEDEMSHFWHRPQGTKKDIPLRRVWWNLDPEKRRDLADKLPRVGYEDRENMEGPFALHEQPGAHMPMENWKYELRKHGGDHLMAAYEAWVGSGTLIDEMEEFPNVLRAAGLPGVVHRDPYKGQAGVVPVHLDIRRPLDTADIPEEVLASLEAASKKARYKPRAYDVDAWDKRNITPRQWIEDLHKDLAEGTNYVWTRMPDWVTQTLQAHGYDGIKDYGGKYHPTKHGVWVPFEERQVKSAYGNKKWDPNSNKLNKAQQAGEKPIEAGLKEVLNPYSNKPFGQYESFFVTKDGTVLDVRNSGFVSHDGVSRSLLRKYNDSSPDQNPHVHLMHETGAVRGWMAGDEFGVHHGRNVTSAQVRAINELKGKANRPKFMYFAEDVPHGEIVADGDDYNAWLNERNIQWKKGRKIAILMKKAQGNTFKATLYHGTKATNLPGVLLASASRGHDAGNMGKGVYLTPRKDIAKWYAGMRDEGVLQTSVRLDNPAIVTHENKREAVEDFARRLGVASTPIYDGGIQTNHDWAHELTEKARTAGHDGIIWKTLDGQIGEVVSFRDVPVTGAQHE